MNLFDDRAIVGYSPEFWRQSSNTWDQADLLAVDQRFKGKRN
jgi:hypothetical protein